MCSINWAKIEKVFRLFFPEFSNKVTWVVIIAGLSLTSSSILQNILNKILENEFNIKILDGYDSLVGLALITLGLTHNILLQREKTKIEVNGKSNGEIEKETLSREHDLMLYQKITSGFEEFYLTEYISSLTDDHSYSRSEKARLQDLVYYSQEAEYDFLNTELNERFTEFGQALSRVMNWTALHFFHHPSHIVMENQTYCLYPELNPDRGGEDDRLGEYNQYALEIVKLTDELLEKYKLFRSSVRHSLYI